MSSLTSWHVIRLARSVKRHILMSICNNLKIQFNISDVMRKGELEAESRTAPKTQNSPGRRTPRMAARGCQQGLLPAQPGCRNHAVLATGLTRHPQLPARAAVPTASQLDWVFALCSLPSSPLRIILSGDSFCAEFLCGFGTGQVNSY